MLCCSQMKLKKASIEIAGWYGVTAVFSAYALVSYEIIEPRDLLYQLLNLTGAAGIIINSLNKKDYQPVALNVVWFFVALSAIVTMLL